MTSQPKAEDLTLPEPARTLLSRTRGILDTYVTPRTPDRSGWIINGEAVVETRAQLARETRTCDRPDDLANWFEQDGINALLSAAGIDPERIRDETGSAMRTGGNTVILELDQDRSAWGP